MHILSSRVAAGAVVTTLLATLLVLLPPQVRVEAQTAEGLVGRVPVERLAGAGRIATAVAISEASFDSSEVVYLARADQYADALAGGPLASQDDAPVLLTNQDSLPPEVAAEIGRLGAGRAVLLGGEAAVSAAVEDALDTLGLQVDRLSGDNRFATATAIAQRMGNPSVVYVAEGANADPNRGFPDALAVGPLAAVGRNPILLAVNETVPADTVTAIQSLEPDEIVVLGGTAALSDAVFAILEGLAPAARRIAGANRFETSALLYDESLAAGLSARGRWLATGLSFPDALAAGPAIAQAGETLLLVDGTNVAASPDVNERLAANYCTLERLVLLGGEAAVTADAATQLEEVLPIDTECSTTGSLPGPSDLAACPTGGFDATDLAALISTLDPELDPDGDGFTTGEEINSLGFSPTEPLRFNPLIADIPQVDLEFDGALELTAEGEFIDGFSDELTEIDSEEVTETQTNEETHTTQNNLSVGAKVKTEVSFSPKPSFGVTATGTFETGFSRGNSLSLTLTDEAKTSRSSSLTSTQTRTEDYTGASLLLDVTVVNNSDVGVRLTDASLLPYLYLNRGENGQSLGADRSAYALPPMEAAAISGSQDLAPTIGPNQSAQLRFNTIEDLSLDQYYAFLDDFGGLEFRLQGLQLESIGDVDIRNDGADFAQFLTTIRNNTVPIVIDADPATGPTTHYVSTTFERDEGGFGVGVTLCQALDLIAGYDLTTVTEDLVVEGETSEVTYIEALAGLPGGSYGTSPTRAWALATTTAESGEPIDVDQVVLGPSDGARLIHIVDEDGDGLSEIDEVRLYGTSDAETDSDDDGIDDAEEASATPWTVEVTTVSGTVLRSYDVRSDPAVADIDGDGVSDPDERDGLTDPFRADTDGDGDDDGADTDPLVAPDGTGPGGPAIPEPLHHWAIVGGDDLPTTDPVNATDNTYEIADVGADRSPLRLCTSGGGASNADSANFNRDLGTVPGAGDGLGYAFGRVRPDATVATVAECGYARTFDEGARSQDVNLWGESFGLSLWARLDDDQPRVILAGDGRPGRLQVTFEGIGGGQGEIRVGTTTVPFTGSDNTYEGATTDYGARVTVPSDGTGWRHFYIGVVREPTLTRASVYEGGRYVDGDRWTTESATGQNVTTQPASPFVVGLGHYTQVMSRPLTGPDRRRVVGHMPFMFVRDDDLFHAGTDSGTGLDDVRLYEFTTLEDQDQWQCALAAAGPDGDADAQLEGCGG